MVSGHPQAVGSVLGGLAEQADRQAEKSVWEALQTWSMGGGEGGWVRLLPTGCCEQPYPTPFPLHLFPMLQDSRASHVLFSACW